MSFDRLLFRTLNAHFDVCPRCFWFSYEYIAVHSYGVIKRDTNVHPGACF